jgi:hypothetical protein
LSAHAFVLSLESRGATLEVEAGRLRVTPSHVLTDSDRAMWREHKAGIMRVLATLGTTPSKAPASTCRSFSVGAAYNATEARQFAHELFQRGAVDARQRAQLLAYAEEPTR